MFKHGNRHIPTTVCLRPSDLHAEELKCSVSQNIGVNSLGMPAHLSVSDKQKMEKWSPKGT